MIVDEAFIDATPEHSITSLAGTADAPNLIVFRSLGKFFGLAGVRVGFLFAGDELRQKMAEGIGPWTISGPAREVARQALSDNTWQANMRPRLLAEGQRLHDLLTPLGELRATALFATLTTSSAAELHEHLAQRAILTRCFVDQPLLRFGLPGNETGWQMLTKALADWKAA